MAFRINFFHFCTVGLEIKKLDTDILILYIDWGSWSGLRLPSGNRRFFCWKQLAKGLLLEYGKIVGALGRHAVMCGKWKLWIYSDCPSPCAAGLLFFTWTLSDWQVYFSGRWQSLVWTISTSRVFYGWRLLDWKREIKNKKKEVKECRNFQS